MAIMFKIRPPEDKMGMGPQTEEEQAKFKDEVIDFYGAGTTHAMPNAKPNKRDVTLSVYDPGTGLEVPKPSINAVHIFPTGMKLTRDVLVELFGENVRNEVMTAYIPPLLGDTRRS